MIDKNKILGEEELPIPVPSTDVAWKAMLKKLEEDDRKPVPIVGSSSKSILRILIGIAFLFFILWMGWYFISTSKSSQENTQQVSRNTSNNTSDQISNQQSNSNSSELNPEKNSKNDNQSEVNNQLTKESKEKISKTKAGSNKQAVNSKKRNKNNSMSKGNRKKGSISNTSGQDNGQSLPTVDDEYFKYSSINYALFSGGAINKPLFAKMKISGSTDEPEPVQNSYWLMEAGLEWNLAIPFSSAKNIMDGPNGKFQPYRILLPGAWLRIEAGKHSMSLGINPFYTALIPNKPFYQLDSTGSRNDTTYVAFVSKSLNKTFGLSAAFEYNYNLRDGFWIGAGIQSNFWANGLITQSGEMQSQPPGGAPVIITKNKTERAINDNDWNSFNKTQIGLTTQFFYRKKPWDAGMRFMLPITPLAKNEGPSNPFRAEFLFRIKLLDWRIKQ